MSVIVVCDMLDNTSVIHSHDFSTSPTQRDSGQGLCILGIASPRGPALYLYDCPMFT